MRGPSLGLMAGSKVISPDPPDLLSVVVSNTGGDIPQINDGGSVVIVAAAATGHVDTLLLNDSPSSRLYRIDSASGSVGRRVTIMWVPNPNPGPALVDMTWIGTAPTNLQWASFNLEGCGQNPSVTTDGYSYGGQPNPSTSPTLTGKGLLISCMVIRGSQEVAPLYETIYSTSIKDSNSVGVSVGFAASFEDQAWILPGGGYMAFGLVGIR